MNIQHVASVISMIGTGFGLFSRVPQVYKTYKSKSAKDLSTKTLCINITANCCFLFYTIVHKQYPIMINNLSVIILESSLIYMKNTYATMKKSSSGTSLIDLVEMNNDEEN